MNQGESRGQWKNKKAMYMEEETYSPTVWIEIIMLSSLIDLHEGREVVTIYIKGSFLKMKCQKMWNYLLG